MNYEHHSTHRFRGIWCINGGPFCWCPDSKSRTLWDVHWSPRFLETPTCHIKNMASVLKVACNGVIMAVFRLWPSILKVVYKFVIMPVSSTWLFP